MNRGGMGNIKGSVVVRIIIIILDHPFGLARLGLGLGLGRGLEHSLCLVGPSTAAER